MKRSNVNVIIDNAINSQDYYRMYSSRDFYRGTSFKMAGAWTPDTHYFNDEHIIDFISCEGALLYCLRGHLSSEWNKPNLIYKDDIIVGVESNPYWAFIMGNSGKGQKGDIGPIGPSGTDGITPQLKIEDGRWLLSMDKGQTWQDIGQATGDPGQNGTDGKNGSDGIGVIPGGTTGQALVKKSDADYDTEWKTISEGGEIPKFDAEGNCELSNLSATNIQLSGNIVQEYEESDVSLDPTIHSLNAIIHADSISSVDFAISEEYDKLTLNKLYRGIVFNTGVDGPITVNFIGSNTVRIATSYGEGFNELYNVVIPGQAAMEYLFKPLSKTFISETGTNVYRGYVYILNPSQYTLSENSETAHTATLKVANNL